MEVTCAVCHEKFPSLDVFQQHSIFMHPKEVMEFNMLQAQINSLVDVKDVCQEAREVVLERRAKYGTPENNFENIGKKWAVTLGLKEPISPPLVVLMMIDLKTCREQFKPNRDNLVDICGYALCGEMISEK